MRKPESTHLADPPGAGQGGLLASFAHALRGVVEVTVRERNMRIHVGAGVALGVLGGEVALPAPAGALLVLCAALVLGSELANSALESLVDMTTTERRPEARRAKDAAAGSVLVAAAGSALAGAWILWANRVAVEAALPRLAARGPGGAAVVLLAAWLLVPGARPLALDAVAGLGGVAVLLALAPGSESPPLWALAALLFALAVASALRARAEGLR
ncbi:MAG TPA: diacylglycerol kinase family protein [Anaeromyxobacteraceae bacterium]|nr:diacylglycerol kinase family protein [Anaeromyxobacteraceae bacterium]